MIVFTSYAGIGLVGDSCLRSFFCIRTGAVGGVAMVVGRFFKSSLNTRSFEHRVWLAG